MTPLPATDFAALALHTLAHLPCDGPENLHDPAYLDWVRRELPATTWEPIATDAAVLEQLIRAHDAGMALQGLPLLFEDIEDYRPTTGRALAQVAEAEVADPGVLAELSGLDPSLIEVLHCAMAQMAPDFEAVYQARIQPALASACADVAPWLREACGRLPSLAEWPVELAGSLGPRGRVFPDRIMVGAPAPWTDLEPATSAVLALHECTVHLAAEQVGEDYVHMEWCALLELVALCADGPLHAPCSAWLNQLDLAPLVAAVRQRSLAPADLLDALSQPGADPATVLGAMSTR